MKLLDKLYKAFWNGMVKGNDDKRMSKQTLPEGIAAITDVPYVDDGKRAHLLDFYYPENTEGKLPVVIDIHGGGLMYAYKELNKNYCYNIAKRGFAVINVSYSLAPDDRYPECLKDVMLALKWIGENIEKYSFCDKNRTYITGDSAGGFLAAYACLLCTSEELRNVYGVEKPDLELRALGATSGMFEMNVSLAALLSPGVFGKGGLKKSKYRDYVDFNKIVPMGKLPPCYLVTSSEDMIHGSTIAFKNILDKEGIEYELDDFPKCKGVKLEHVFSVLYPIEYEQSVTAIDHMTEFFLSR